MECNCEENTKKIQQLEEKVGVLETFKKWAEPILKSMELMQKDVEKTSNNVTWMRNIGAFVLIAIGTVFLNWILPSLDVVQEDQKKIIENMYDNNYLTMKAIKDTELNTQNIINKLEKKLDKSIIKSSKINHNATVRKIKEVIGQ